MKKYLKIIGIILIIWCILVAIDYIRITHISYSVKPLITLNKIEYEDMGTIGTKYVGLGYTVDDYEIKYTMGSGIKIKLFGLIPIYAIEAQ